MVEIAAEANVAKRGHFFSLSLEKLTIDIVKSGPRLHKIHCLRLRTAKLEAVCETGREGKSALIRPRIL